MSYSDDKLQLLALAEERQAHGFTTKECPSPGLVRTMVSELREEQNKQFVTFRLPDTSEAMYCLCQYAGTRENGYEALRAVHPEARIRWDHRIHTRKSPSPAQKHERSARAESDRRSSKVRQRTYKAHEKQGGELEVFWRHRHRTMQSIENILSIPEMLVSANVPAVEAESLLEDLNELAAYTDSLISLIHSKVDDAAFAEKIAKLRNVDGRSPEEAETFLAQADKLERKRRQRLDG